MPILRRTERSLAGADVGNETPWRERSWVTDEFIGYEPTERQLEGAAPQEPSEHRSASQRSQLGGTDVGFLQATAGHATHAVVIRADAANIDQCNLPHVPDWVCRS